MSKPMTKKEWDNLYKWWQRALGYREGVVPALDRIEATIENGGYAPEPVTETELLEWVYTHRPWGKGHDDNVFHDTDLAAAIRKAIECNLAVMLESDFTGNEVTLEKDGSNDRVTFEGVQTLSWMARMIAAIAYSVSEGVDVSHLVGDYKWEPEWGE